MRYYKNNLLLSIIIVTYNSEPFIIHCLSSIYSTIPKNIKFEIIIIDNNSKRDIETSIKKGFNSVIFIKNNKNKGFAKACNQGLKISKGEHIFFLNPDTIVSKKAIEGLLKFLQQNPRAGVVGPLLLRPSGEIQKWQMGYEKKFWRILLEEIIEKITLIFKPKWFLKIASLIDLNYADHYITREVDWVNGAAMMVRKKILDEVGGFDERFFLYYEEIDLQKRIKDGEWKIYHLPSAKVIHYGSGNLRNHSGNKLRKISRNLYFEKYRFDLYYKYLVYTTIILGISIRVFHLTKNIPLEFDEAVVWNVSILKIHNIIYGIYPHFKFHPPLFYLFIHFWRKISDLEIWLRLPSLMTSIFSIYVLYIFLKEISNKKVSMLGVFLYSISPFAIWWSTELRVYQMLFLISLIYLFIYVKFVKYNKFSYLSFLLLIGSLGLHLDYSFIWTFLLVNTHYLITNLKIIRINKNIFRWIAINSATLVNLVPYIIKTGKLTLNSHSALTWIDKPYTSNILQTIAELFYSDRVSINLYKNIFSFEFFFLVTLVLICYGIFTLIKEKNKLKTIPVFIVLIPLFISYIVSQFYPIFVAKNLFVVSLGLIILVALSLGKLKSNLLFVIMIVVIFSSNLWVVQQFYKNNPNWEKAAIFFNQLNLRNHKILFLPSWFRETFLYYNHRFNLIKSTKQLVFTSSSKQTFKLATDYKKSGINNCVIYDTYRKFTEENFYQIYPKGDVSNFFESYPKKLNLGGGIRIYCT